MRMKRVVRAGLVVADVAVRCVERKSVRCINGSSNILHLEVNTVRVSTISSRLFWCFMLPSDFSLGSLSFSPVHPLEDKGEYLLEYIPKMTNTTTIRGPAYLMTISPYIVMAQKLATTRKLSHGSPLVHVVRPTI